MKKMKGGATSMTLSVICARGERGGGGGQTGARPCFSVSSRAPVRRTRCLIFSPMLRKRGPSTSSSKGLSCCTRWLRVYCARAKREREWGKGRLVRDKRDLPLPPDAPDSCDRTHGVALPDLCVQGRGAGGSRDGGAREAGQCARKGVANENVAPLPGRDPRRRDALGPARALRPPAIWVQSRALLHCTKCGPAAAAHTHVRAPIGRDCSLSTAGRTFVRFRLDCAMRALVRASARTARVACTRRARVACIREACLSGARG
jgi:hypothetical protein